MTSSSASSRATSAAGPPASRSPVDVLAAVVERAALDGSTCVPAAVVAAALRGAGVESPGPVAEEADDTGRVIAYLDERLFGHSRWARVEEEVAEHLVEVVTRSGPDAVRVVDAPRGSRVPDLSGAPDAPDAPGAAGAVVVEHASRLGLGEAADLLSRLLAADGEPRLLLVGDPSLPYAPGPGRVLADVVASGVVPVDTAVAGSGDAGTGGQLAALVRSLRAGVLPAVDPSRREVVVTPADDPDQAVRRAVQLVTSSVPRAFDLAGPDVLVLAPRRGGRTGAEALRAALDAAGAGDVRTATADAAATEAAEAVVLVLAAESAGSITRSLLVGAATQAGRHLSVVHQAGPALVEAVAHRPHPPRRTRLATLLADALG